ncbi:hypothetical protein BESB_037350 [Besnoitia besnoiti]|uniref:Uncharacterized protein n=1 Tax=Besnoitia besnoiti TaxID=94643 RepID=A0A2A9MN66_BESBE|nr:hypothetical protein BESB_037350 [Besnoitia besnoiti]PFH37277.1 hypothetical protein BESB_037350 [Besnoitia besnoiti]
MLFRQTVLEPERSREAVCGQFVPRALDSDVRRIERQSNARGAPSAEASESTCAAPQDGEEEVSSEATPTPVSLQDVQLVWHRGHHLCVRDLSSFFGSSAAFRRNPLTQICDELYAEADAEPEASLQDSSEAAVRRESQLRRYTEDREEGCRGAHSQADDELTDKRACIDSGERFSLVFALSAACEPSGEAGTHDLPCASPAEPCERDPVSLIQPTFGEVRTIRRLRIAAARHCGVAPSADRLLLLSRFNHLHVLRVSAETGRFVVERRLRLPALAAAREPAPACTACRLGGRAAFLLPQSSADAEKVKEEGCREPAAHPSRRPAKGRQPPHAPDAGAQASQTHAARRHEGSGSRVELPLSAADVAAASLQARLAPAEPVAVLEGEGIFAVLLNPSASHVVVGKVVQQAAEAHEGEVGAGGGAAGRRRSYAEMRDAKDRRERASAAREASRTRSALLSDACREREGISLESELAQTPFLSLRLPGVIRHMQLVKLEARRHAEAARGGECDEGDWREASQSNSTRDGCARSVDQTARRIGKGSLSPERPSSSEAGAAAAVLIVVLESRDELAFVRERRGLSVGPVPPQAASLRHSLLFFRLPFAVSAAAAASHLASSPCRPCPRPRAAPSGSPQTADPRVDCAHQLLPGASLEFTSSASFPRRPEEMRRPPDLTTSVAATSAAGGCGVVLLSSTQGLTVIRISLPEDAEEASSGLQASASRSSDAGACGSSGDAARLCRHRGIRCECCACRTPSRTDALGARAPRHCLRRPQTDAAGVADIVFRAVFERLLAAGLPLSSQVMAHAPWPASARASSAPSSAAAPAARPASPFRILHRLCDGWCDSAATSGASSRCAASRIFSPMEAGGRANAGDGLPCPRCGWGLRWGIGDASTAGAAEASLLASSCAVSSSPQPALTACFSPRLSCVLPCPAKPHPAPSGWRANRFLFLCLDRLAASCVLATVAYVHPTRPEKLPSDKRLAASAETPPEADAALARKKQKLDASQAGKIISEAQRPLLPTSREAATSQEVADAFAAGRGPPPQALPGAPQASQVRWDSKFIALSPLRLRACGATGECIRFRSLTPLFAVCRSRARPASAPARSVAGKSDEAAAGAQEPRGAMEREAARERTQRAQMHVAWLLLGLTERASDWLLLLTCRNYGEGGRERWSLVPLQCLYTRTHFTDAAYVPSLPLSPRSRFPFRSELVPTFSFPASFASSRAARSLASAFGAQAFSPRAAGLWRFLKNAIEGPQEEDEGGTLYVVGGRWPHSVLYGLRVGHRLSLELPSAREGLCRSLSSAPLGLPASASPRGVPSRAAFSQILSPSPGTRAPSGVSAKRALPAERPVAAWLLPPLSVRRRTARENPARVMILSRRRGSRADAEPQDATAERLSADMNPHWILVETFASRTEASFIDCFGRRVDASEGTSGEEGGDRAQKKGKTEAAGGAEQEGTRSHDDVEAAEDPKGERKSAEAKKPHSCDGLVLRRDLKTLHVARVVRRRSGEAALLQVTRDAVYVHRQGSQASECFPFSILRANTDAYRRRCLPQSFSRDDASDGKAAKSNAENSFACDAAMCKGAGRAAEDQAETNCENEIGFCDDELVKAGGTGRRLWLLTSSGDLLTFELRDCRADSPFVALFPTPFLQGARGLLASPPLSPASPHFDPPLVTAAFVAPLSASTVSLLRAFAASPCASSALDGRRATLSRAYLWVAAFADGRVVMEGERLTALRPRRRGSRGAERKDATTETLRILAEEGSEAREARRLSDEQNGREESEAHACEEDEMSVGWRCLGSLAPSEVHSLSLCAPAYLVAGTQDGQLFAWSLASFFAPSVGLFSSSPLPSPRASLPPRAAPSTACAPPSSSHSSSSPASFFLFPCSSSSSSSSVSAAALCVSFPGGGAPGGEREGRQTRGLESPPFHPLPAPVWFARLGALPLHVSPIQHMTSPQRSPSSGRQRETVTAGAAASREDGAQARLERRETSLTGAGFEEAEAPRDTDTDTDGGEDSGTSEDDDEGDLGGLPRGCLVRHGGAQATAESTGRRSSANAGVWRLLLCEGGMSEEDDEERRTERRTRAAAEAGFVESDGARRRPRIPTDLNPALDGLPFLPVFGDAVATSGAASSPPMPRSSHCLPPLRCLPCFAPVLAGASPSPSAAEGLAVAPPRPQPTCRCAEPASAALGVAWSTAAASREKLSGRRRRRVRAASREDRESLRLLCLFRGNADSGLAPRRTWAVDVREALLVTETVPLPFIANKLAAHTERLTEPLVAFIGRFPPSSPSSLPAPPHLSPSAPSSYSSSPSSSSPSSSSSSSSSGTAPLSLPSPVEGLGPFGVFLCGCGGPAAAKSPPGVPPLSSSSSSPPPAASFGSAQMHKLLASLRLSASQDSDAAAEAVTAPGKRTASSVFIPSSLRQCASPSLPPCELVPLSLSFWAAPRDSPCGQPRALPARSPVSSSSADASAAASPASAQDAACVAAVGFRPRYRISTSPFLARLSQAQQAVLWQELHRLDPELFRERNSQLAALPRPLLRWGLRALCSLGRRRVDAAPGEACFASLLAALLAPSVRRRRTFLNRLRMRQGAAPAEWRRLLRVRFFVALLDHLWLTSDRLLASFEHQVERTRAQLRQLEAEQAEGAAADGVQRRADAPAEDAALAALHPPHPPQQACAPAPAAGVRAFPEAEETLDELRQRLASRSAQHVETLRVKLQNREARRSAFATHARGLRRRQEAFRRRGGLPPFEAATPVEAEAEAETETASDDEGGAECLLARRPARGDSLEVAEAAAEKTDAEEAGGGGRGGKVVYLAVGGQCVGAARRGEAAAREKGEVARRADGTCVCFGEGLGDESDTRAHSHMPDAMERMRLLLSGKRHPVASRVFRCTADEPPNVAGFLLLLAVEAGCDATRPPEAREPATETNASEGSHATCSCEDARQGERQREATPRPPGVNTPSPSAERQDEGAGAGEFASGAAAGVEASPRERPTVERRAGAAASSTSRRETPLPASRPARSSPFSLASPSVSLAPVCLFPMAFPVEAAAPIEGGRFLAVGGNATVALLALKRARKAEKIAAEGARRREESESGLRAVRLRTVCTFSLGDFANSRVAGISAAPGDSGLLTVTLTAKKGGVGGRVLLLRWCEEARQLVCVAAGEDEEGRDLAAGAALEVGGLPHMQLALARGGRRLVASQLSASFSSLTAHSEFALAAPALTMVVTQPPFFAFSQLRFAKLPSRQGASLPLAAVTEKVAADAEAPSLAARLQAESWLPEHARGERVPAGGERLFCGACGAPLAAEGEAGRKATQTEATMRGSACEMLSLGEPPPCAPAPVLIPCLDGSVTAVFTVSASESPPLASGSPASASCLVSCSSCELSGSPSSSAASQRAGGDGPAAAETRVGDPRDADVEAALEAPWRPAGAAPLRLRHWLASPGSPSRAAEVCLDLALLLRLLHSGLPCPSCSATPASGAALAPFSADFFFAFSPRQQHLLRMLWKRFEFLRLRPLCMQPQRVVARLARAAQSLQTRLAADAQRAASALEAALAAARGLEARGEPPAPLDSRWGSSDREADAREARRERGETEDAGEAEAAGDPKGEEEECRAEASDGDDPRRAGRRESQASLERQERAAAAVQRLGNDLNDLALEWTKGVSVFFPESFSADAFSASHSEAPEGSQLFALAACGSAPPTPPPELPAASLQYLRRGTCWLLRCSAATAALVRRLHSQRRAFFGRRRDRRREPGDAGDSEDFRPAPSSSSVSSAAPAFYSQWATLEQRLLAFLRLLADLYTGHQRLTVCARQRLEWQPLVARVAEPLPCAPHPSPPPASGSASLAPAGCLAAADPFAPCAAASAVGPELGLSPPSSSLASGGSPPVAFPPLMSSSALLTELQGAARRALAALRKQLEALEETQAPRRLLADGEGAQAGRRGEGEGELDDAERRIVDQRERSQSVAVARGETCDGETHNEERKKEGDGSSRAEPEEEDTRAAGGALEEMQDANVPGQLGSEPPLGAALGDARLKAERVRQQLLELLDEVDSSGAGAAAWEKEEGRDARAESAATSRHPTRSGGETDAQRAKARDGRGAACEDAEVPSREREGRSLCRADESTGQNGAAENSRLRKLQRQLTAARLLLLELEATGRGMQPARGGDATTEEAVEDADLRRYEEGKGTRGMGAGGTKGDDKDGEMRDGETKQTQEVSRQVQEESGFSDADVEIASVWSLSSFSPDALSEQEDEMRSKRRSSRFVLSSRPRPARSSALTVAHGPGAALSTDEGEPRTADSLEDDTARRVGILLSCLQDAARMVKELEARWQSRDVAPSASSRPAAWLCWEDPSDDSLPSLLRPSRASPASPSSLSSRFTAAGNGTRSDEGGGNAIGAERGRARGDRLDCSGPVGRGEPERNEARLEDAKNALAAAAFARGGTPLFWFFCSSLAFFANSPSSLPRLKAEVFLAGGAETRPALGDEMVAPRPRCPFCARGESEASEETQRVGTGDFASAIDRARHSARRLEREEGSWRAPWPRRARGARDAAEAAAAARSAPAGLRPGTRCDWPCEGEASETEETWQEQEAWRLFWGSEEEADAAEVERRRERRRAQELRMLQEDRERRRRALREDDWLEGAEEDPGKEGPRGGDPREAPSPEGCRRRPDARRRAARRGGGDAEAALAEDAGAEGSEAEGYDARLCVDADMLSALLHLSEEAESELAEVLPFLPAEPESVAECRRAVRAVALLPPL